MSFSEIVVNTLSGGWSHKIRPQIARVTIQSEPNLLPQALLSDMRWLEKVTGGTAVVYGACFADWKAGRTPKDYDIALMTPHHPLLAWASVLAATPFSKRKFGRYLWRHALPWKRVRLRTKSGLLDIGMFQRPTDEQHAICEIADNADFGVIAKAATLDCTYTSDRFTEGHAHRVIRCRPLHTRRDYRSGIYKRWPKYALKKYPEWTVEYESPADARFFEWANQRRAELRAIYEKNPDKVIEELAREYEGRRGFTSPRPGVQP